MQNGLTAAATTAAIIAALATAGWATPASAAPAAGAAAAPNGAALYAAHCAKCHDHAKGHMPTREALAERPSINIAMTLLAGAMRPEAAGLTHADANAIADYLTAGSAARNAVLRPDPCPGTAAPIRFSAADWNGWGRDLAQSRFQPHSGLAARDLARLKVKWAFAYPGSMTWGQPTVVGGRVYVASTTGQVYALDAATGCTIWSRNVGTPVRTAISIGPGFSGHRAVAYFGDLSARAYAVDADTGARIWRTRVSTHPMARITGSPVLYHDRLLVPVSSFEEGAAADAAYSCCSFRGGVVALDARSGRVIWVRHTVSGPLRSYHRKGDPTRLYGPAGGAVWNAPTIDAARGVVYFGIGNDYTDIDSPATDAVMAVSLATGQVRWTRQLVRHDDWSSGCTLGGPCPSRPGDDADFAASTILVPLPSGRRVLVAGQKSGMVYGLDPSARGKVLWSKRVGGGGVFGGIEWGMAAIGSTVYVPISDSMPSHPTEVPRPGLAALDAATGKLLWWKPAPPPVCAWGAADCRAAQSQAASAIDGVVFSGSQDGHLRAYAARDGRILWDFDTARHFPAVDAESAHGGSLDAGGPVVVDGVIYLNSGYGQFLGRGGNLLLALSVDGK